MTDGDPEPSHAAVVPLVLLLAGASLMAASGLGALLAGRRARAADLVGAGTIGAGAVMALTGVAASLVNGTGSALECDWALPWGRFSVALDGLSAAMLLPFLVIPALAAVYSTGYWPQSAHGRTAPKARVFMGLLAAALVIVPLARDAVVFLMSFEVMTLSAYFLITTEDDRAEAAHAGWTYFIASHVSLMFLFGAFAVYRVGTGGFELSAAAASALGPGARSAVFVLALAGFGIKAGVMPLHVWLPGAHASAPSHVSAVLSGVVIKVGVYGVARVAGILPDPPMVWGLLLLLLGAASGIVGVAYAVGQHDLKRLLAYHSIENIGIIMMGLGGALLGRWGHRPEIVALCLACAVMHVWNHGLFKALLFLSAGSVVHATGTREIDRMGGLWRRMPWSGALFTLGAAAICGLPPLNGFISELFLYLGAFESLRGGAAGLVSLAAPALALIGGLACACFVKVVGCVFLGRARSEATDGAHECGWAMRWPMVALAGACVVLGLAPVLAVPVLNRAMAAWSGGRVATPSLTALVPFGTLGVVLSVFAAVVMVVLLGARSRRSARAATWGCGYASPTARMQYTSSSLARSLVHLFGTVLRPTEHAPRVEGPFPRAASYEGRVDDAVLERVVAPFCRRVADRLERLRHLQTGRIQAYIVYLLITTLGLLLLVVPLGQLLRRLVTE